MRNEVIRINAQNGKFNDELSWLDKTSNNVAQLSI